MNLTYKIAPIVIVMGVTFGAPARAQASSAVCTDIRAAQAVNQVLFETLWAMPFRHLVAEYTGLPYQDLSLASPPDAVRINAMEVKINQDLIKSVVKIDATKIVNGAYDPASGLCSGTIVFTPPVAADTAAAGFGSAPRSYPISFRITSRGPSAAEWEVDRVTGGQSLVDFWHAGIGRLYSAQLQDPNARQSIDQLRAKVVAQNKALQAQEARERQLAQECVNRGGFWGRHEIRRQDANGYLSPGVPAGDPNHCITN